MQVILAATASDDGGSWNVFASVCKWFSVAVIIMFVALFIVLGSALAGVLAWQLQYSCRSWRKTNHT
jgi:hypothetical protein